MFRVVTCSLLLILLLPGSQLPAQDLNEDHFVRYTTQQGLSNNMITGIAQDSIGYLWVATHSGLNRYNGNQFVQFHSSNDSNSLPAEALSGLVWLDRRRLVLCGNGLHIIDTYTGQARNLYIPYHNKQYQYKFNYIMSVTSNAAGELFILTRGGFYHFDKEYRLLFRYDHFRDDQVATSPFAFGRELFWLDNEKLMIVATNGIHLYDMSVRKFSVMKPSDWPAFSEFLDYPRKFYKFFQPAAGSFLIMKPGKDSLLFLDKNTGSKSITQMPFNPGNLGFYYRSAIIPVSDSVMYLTSHESGFYKIAVERASGKIRFYPEKYFSSYYCKSILVDKDRTVWVATNKGLFRQDNTQAHMQQAVVPAAVEHAMPNTVIDGLCVANNKLFVGTRGDGGLLVYDKKTLQFERQLTIGTGIENINNIYALVRSGKDHLLLGTNGPMFNLDLKTFAFTKIIPRGWNPDTDWISDLYNDSRGNMWVTSSNIYCKAAGTDSFAVIANTKKLFNKIHMPNHLSEDRGGNIWMAGHGVCRYNISTRTFDWFIDSFPYIKMPDRQVNKMIVDKNDNLWIACYNNGLVRYNMNERTFRHFTREDGLPDNNLASLFIVGNKLWLAGYSGIACLDLSTYRITSFGKEDGFPEIGRAHV